MKNILVTGGLGYIGSHTVLELIARGYEVFVIDNLSNSHIDTLDRIEKISGKRPAFFEFDLCDKDRVDKFFSQNQIDSVIHFAASKAVGESMQVPLKYYRNNLLPLMNILEAMIAYNVDRIVFSSSCTVYGQPDKLPVDEKAPVQKAESPYGNTKQISEEMIADTVRASESMKAISLRYFNPIGAHESALIGELPIGTPNCLVPYVTQTAIGVREQLTIHGDDYDTPDGTCIRDYLHIVDLAEAHINAIEYMHDGGNKDRIGYFNLGTGRGYSVQEVVDEFEKVTEQKLNYKIGPRREGDVEEVYADPSLAEKELKWKAKRGLGEMLKSAWEWEKNYRKN
ncbi:UDP-glucose 4-epimerase GalE [Candidatus Parcubacteria bacterium]|nr:MAG: UDP-glucose 4-epimerase GalE [Candidatus Parcubacteria bacterium]